MESRPPDSDLRPIELRLLGTTHLFDSNGQEVREVLRQPKRFALLTYLLMQGRGGFVRRDSLLAMFWPTNDGTHARGSLRQALRFLRRHLGDDVISRRGAEDVGLSVGRWICDAHTFEALVSDGRAAEAMALYAGDLLEGFLVDGAPAFEDWLEERRMALRQKATKAARSLAMMAEDHGDPAAVAFWANRAASFVPYEKGTVRTVMELLDRVGDRAGALGAYRRLEQWLRDEFDSKPAPETQSLLESILERATPFHAQQDATALTPTSSPAMWFPSRSATARRVDPDRRVWPDHERRRSGMTWDGTERRTGERRAASQDRRCGIDRREIGATLSAEATLGQTN